jgi:hypothetical protein
MDLTGWTPIYSYFAGGRLMLDWCHTGRRRFSEPFFRDTMDAVTRDFAALLFRHQSTMEEAAEWSRQNPGMSPSGFIFHMSRCGSTLVSQMLAAAPANRTLSEPTPLNAVVRASLLDASIPRAALADWLRTLVSLLGCPLVGETHYFLKLECWHALALPLFVEAFPGTPWIFLYRNPAEVLVSQARVPGAWTVPCGLEPEVFGIRPEDALAPRDRYQARALAAICQAALQYRALGRGLLVNYEQLPEFVGGPLARHCGVTFSPAELERMASVPKEALTPALQALVDRWISPHFERLEAARGRR